jgi:hypothetical protein
MYSFARRKLRARLQRALETLPEMLLEILPDLCLAISVERIAHALDVD